MKVKLYRSNFNKTGVIGEMECGGHVFTTLEHAYDDHGHIFTKLTDGEYICKKGIHRLSDLVPFETFEITEVKGHTGILFHVGNYNHDSSGCVLVGLGYGNNKTIITSSKQGFAKFMDILKDCEEFDLVVTSSNQ